VRRGPTASGLASALYLAAVAKRGEEEAEGQISIRFGHISLPLSAAYTMDRTFEAPRAVARLYRLLKLLGCAGRQIVAPRAGRPSAAQRLTCTFARPQPRLARSAY
jgi:hypothetical protein